MAHLVILHGSNDWYGASRVLLEDVRLLLGTGHEVTVILPESGPMTAALHGLGASVSVEPIHVLRRVKRVGNLRLPVRLPTAVLQADVAILSTVALSGYLPVLRASGCQVLSTVHEILPGPLGTLLARLTATLSSDVIVNSVATGRWVMRGSRRCAAVAYPVAPTRRGDVSPPSVTGPLRLLVVGRVNGGKDQLEALHAVRSARGNGCPASIRFLGGAFPGQERHLEALREELAPLSWASWLGEVSDPETYMAESDVILVPSIRPESFGLVPLEAWANGRRAIGFDQGGLAESLRMVEGIVVPAASISELSLSIEKVARQSELRRAPADDAPLVRTCTSERRLAVWSQVLRNLGRA